MIETVEPVLHLIAEAVDLIGLAIVLVGAIKFLFTYVRIEARRLVGRECATQIQTARRGLGGYILVALEFMIVSDIINSALTHSLESLAGLAAIVVLRTMIGFFLERELRSAEPEPG